MASPHVTRGTFRRSCRTCGWKGTYNTKGRADYFKRQHACARRLAQAERAAAYAEWLAAVDRTPKPCHHKEADHQHGTYVCWTLDGCRCWDCKAAQAEYEDNRRRQQAYGRWDNLVDADPARQHVHALMAAGMGAKRIARAASVSTGTLSKLIYGVYRNSGTGGGCNGPGDLVRPPSKRIRKGTAAALLAVELDLADGAKVDATDTARRAQALMAAGWSASRIATRLGLGRANFTPILHGTRPVTAGTARAMHALYLELADADPTAGATTPAQVASVTRARHFAQVRGWPPPLRIGGRLHAGTALPTPKRPDADVLDLSDHDTGELDEAAILRRLAGDRSVRLTKAERVEVVRRALARGMSGNQIERDLGISQINRYGSVTELRRTTNTNTPRGATA